jgi:AraC family transcriptional regulator
MKKVTKDDYIQSVYKVIFYIEQNYAYDLTLEELSKVASFSKYHFHRVFKSIIGENLGDYIRRVRLSSATLKFKTDKKITQIAQESGYETNASFSKAFKNHFGITPKEFSLNAKKKKGLKMLEPKIVELKPIEVLYVRKEGAYDKSAKEAWEVLMSFAYKNKIKYKKNLMGKDAMMFGIGHDNPNVINEEKLRYDACISWDDKTVQPEGEISTKVIDGGKYAMFLHKGAYENLKSTYDKIGDWIVESGVEVRDLPMFEKYLNRDPRRTKPENLKTEIYVPIK